MCVIIAKYIKEPLSNADDTGTGWVGMKNRDRNYKPVISIVQSNSKGVEKTCILDSVTKYMEGINEYGVCILNAALQVSDDESAAAMARAHAREEDKKSGDYKDPDGIKIKRALNCKTPKAAAESLIDDRMFGHTLIFNKDVCYILEGGRSKEDFEFNSAISERIPEHEWNAPEYYHTLKEVSKDDYIVRTNHGHFLPWSGYQKDSSDVKEMLSRKSSESRHKAVIKNLKKAETIDDIISALSDISDKDTQMNPVRVGDYQNRTKLKTTGQILLIPALKELVYIPIWSQADATNFNKINSHKTETFYSLKAFNPNGIITEKLSNFEGFLLANNCLI